MNKTEQASLEANSNMITVQGVIVGIYSIGRMTILNISTKNAGSWTTKKGNSAEDPGNYPSIIFLDNMSNEANNYKKYDNVCIKCHAGYRRRKNPDGSIYFKQGFFADSIESTKKKMSSLGIDKGGYEDPINQALIKGEVTSVTKTTDRIRTIHMMIESNRQFKDAIDVVCYTPPLVKLCDSLEKGDIIAIFGFIQTKRSKNGDRFMYFQNIVASEVKKVGKTDPHPVSNIKKKETKPADKEITSLKKPAKVKKPLTHADKPEVVSKPKKHVVRKKKETEE